MTIIKSKYCFRGGTMRLISLFVLLVFSFIASAATYPLPAPGNDVIGEVFVVKAPFGQTLETLGLQYGLSSHQMREANPRINPTALLRAGQKIVVPAQFILPKFREGIVINMAELRLYYFPAGGRYVMTFPVAMGRDQWRTPIVITKVVSKEADPVWNVPKSIQATRLAEAGEVLPDAVPPGPDNPLGPYAIHLGKPGYLIHGNNDPNSIGKFVSSGCIRMKNSDITTLYQTVPVGTPVKIIHYPYKLGWFNGDLYLQAQIPVDLPDLESDLNNVSVENAVLAVLKTRPAQIDWDRVRRTTEDHLGIPELIGRGNAQLGHANEARPPLPIENDMYTENSIEGNGNFENTGLSQYSWIDSYSEPEE